MSLQFANIQAPALFSVAAVAVAAAKEHKKDAVHDNRDRPRKGIFRNGANTIITDYKIDENFYYPYSYAKAQQSLCLCIGNFKKTPFSILIASNRKTSPKPVMSQAYPVPFPLPQP